MTNKNRKNEVKLCNIKSEMGPRNKKMGKSQDSKKATKKAPAKTAKEKKAEKRLKKANR